MFVYRASERWESVTTGGTGGDLAGQWFLPSVVWTGKLWIDGGVGNDAAGGRMGGSVYWGGTAVCFGWRMGL